VSEDRVATGIEGFDAQIEEGIPKGSLVLLAGDAGSCKTIFAAQYLYQGASKLGEPGIYVSLAEDRETFLKNMKRMGMDFDSRAGRQIQIPRLCHGYREGCLRDPRQHSGGDRTPEGEASRSRLLHRLVPSLQRSYRGEGSDSHDAR
jgi:hypothetical protein